MSRDDKLIDKHSPLDDWLNAGFDVVEADRATDRPPRIYCTTLKRSECPDLHIKNGFRLCKRAAGGCPLQMIIHKKQRSLED